MLDTLANSSLTQSIIWPNETIERLDKITSRLRELFGPENLSNLFATSVYYLALKAQIKLLQHLNDDSLSCPVYWDLRTSLPSHPSLAADIKTYSEKVDLSASLKALLNSFSEWTTFRSEKIFCCCGRAKGNKERIIPIDIMMNTILKAGTDRLTVNLLVGIKSDDQSHLSEHYNVRRQSKIANDLFIVFMCENRIKVSDGQVLVEPISLKYASQFDLQFLEKEMWKMMSLITA